jgi:hypothetical protein
MLMWTVLEATTRETVNDLIARLKDEPAGGAHAWKLLQLSNIVPPETRMQPLAAIQQPGLYITCLKSAAGLASGLPPVDVLAALGQLCELLPGVSTGSSSCSSNSGASSNSSAISASSHESTPALLLLCGRSLYTAGQALLQLHQQAEAQEVVSPVSVSNETTPPSNQDIDRDSLSAELTAVLLCCVTTMAPALQEAAAELVASGSSTSSNAARRSMRALLQLQLGLQNTLTAASEACNRTSSSSFDSNAACAAQAIIAIIFSMAEEHTHNAEAEIRTALTAVTAQQLVDLGSGICVHLAAGQHWCCANPGCTNLADVLERQLVAGKGTCSACRSVRLCGPACNKAYWKAGHKQVCALFKQRSSQQEQQQS